MSTNHYTADDEQYEASIDSFLDDVRFEGRLMVEGASVHATGDDAIRALADEQGIVLLDHEYAMAVEAFDSGIRQGMAR